MAARLIGQPQSLAHALWKLHSFAGAEIFDIPASNALLFVVNPMPPKTFEKHFNVHPPVEKRIEKLVGYFPI
jgi:heat shock protein HtpX